MEVKELEKPKLCYVGPDISEGKLPAIFYFSLSAKESLTLDPFNQPVTFLADLPLRVFSMTIPGHEEGRDPKEAVGYWASEMAKGNALIPAFVKECSEAATYLVENEIASDLSVAGLSRGAFIACHVAAINPAVKRILGFAPLTRLSHAKEFEEMADQKEVQALALENLKGKLYDRKLRFYIGNHDRRVGTEHTFSFISKLSDAAFENRIRSSPIELIIGPSTGFMGHGTSPEVFKSGAEWLQSEVL